MPAHFGYPHRGDAGKVKILLRDTVTKLGECLAHIQTITGLVAPCIPDFNSLDEVKSFCLLIDPNQEHPWREWWDGLRTETVKYQFAHSLFLFRKVCPMVTTKRVVEASFMKKMSTPSPCVVDRDFLDFIHQEVPRIFRPGWDKGYVDVAHTLTLSTSSCLENSGKNYGARGLNDPISRFGFQRAMGTVPFHESHTCKVVSCEDGGKRRVVTVNSAQCEGLKPLHHLMYGHLSSFSWLCRGSPRVGKKFTSKKGEIFTSGDYESATDNIPTELYRALLTEVLDTCQNVPSSVRQFALSEVQKTLWLPGQRRVYQRRGQLMGSYLSFPLLCLLNYLAFKYTINRDVPVLINGDDIVFRSTVEESERWKENVQRCGLTLSKGKTLTHPTIFTLNSTLFQAREKRGVGVPFFRPKAMFTCPKSALGAAGQFGALVVGLPGSPLKDSIQISFLERYRSWLLRRQYPLRSALGFHISDRVLRMSGFARFERDLTYNKVGPPSPLQSSVLPYGYEQKPRARNKNCTKEMRADRRRMESLFFRELSQLTWLFCPRRKERPPCGPLRWIPPDQLYPRGWKLLAKCGGLPYKSPGDLKTAKLKDCVRPWRRLFWSNYRAERSDKIVFRSGGFTSEVDNALVEGDGLLLFRGRVSR